jgi:uncharacterized membrane protein (UPF0136 family)
MNQLRTSRNVGFALALGSGLIALTSAPSWASMINAFFSGMTLAIAVALQLMIRRERALALMVEQLDLIRAEHAELAHMIKTDGTPPLTPPDHPTMH